LNVKAGVTRLLQRAGVDRAIAYSLIGQGWTVISGPITVWFLASRLSPQEQGFYYTFNSFLGLQIFLELGLGFVVMQFASYEKAGLHWSERRTLEGDPRAKARLASMLRLSMVGYSALAAVFFVVVLPAGLVFFARHDGAATDVVWRLPWAWMVVVTTGTFLLTPLFSIIQGCGLIAESAMLRMCQNIVTSLVSCCFCGVAHVYLRRPCFCRPRF
jgi:MFS family permease